MVFLTFTVQVFTEKSKSKKEKERKETETQIQVLINCPGKNSKMQKIPRELNYRSLKQHSRNTHYKLICLFYADSPRMYITHLHKIHLCTRFMSLIQIIYSDCVTVRLTSAIPNLELWFNLSLLKLILWLWWLLFFTKKHFYPKKLFFDA